MSITKLRISTNIREPGSIATMVECGRRCRKFNCRAIAPQCGVRSIKRRAFGACRSSSAHLDTIICHVHGNALSVAWMNAMNWGTQHKSHRKCSNSIWEEKPTCVQSHVCAICRLISAQTSSSLSSWILEFWKVSIEELLGPTFERLILETSPKAKKSYLRRCHYWPNRQFPSSPGKEHKHHSNTK